MMKARGPVQPGWGTALNRGRHTVGPDDPMERHRGPMAPSTGTLADQGKGTGAAPTLGGVARLKAAVVVVVVQGRGSDGGGTGHHDDGGGVSR
jgi:hypothetical protein